MKLRYLFIQLMAEVSISVYKEQQLEAIKLKYSNLYFLSFFI